jgi:hypothetical protein
MNPDSSRENYSFSKSSTPKVSLDSMTLATKLVSILPSLNLFRLPKT